MKTINATNTSAVTRVGFAAPRIFTGSTSAVITT